MDILAAIKTVSTTKPTIGLGDLLVIFEIWNYEGRQIEYRGRTPSY